MATVYLQGNECHTNGTLPEVGQQIPDFNLFNIKLKEKTLSSFSGKSKLIYSVSSLDTMVCANTTHTLNELAANVTNSEILVVSADLPFAQQRIKKQNKLKNVTLLSMMRDRKFAEDYGILLIDGALAGLATRAVFVTDADNNLIYKELVNDITESPDFNQALKHL